MIDNDKIRATVKSVLLLTPVVIVCWPIWLVVRTVIQRSLPGVMMVHCPPEVCTSIGVTQEENQEGQVTKTTDGVKVSPISYGRYTYSLRLTDGKTYQAGYFHLDAGERKLVSIYVDRPTPKDVHIKATGYDDNALIEEKTLKLEKTDDDTRYYLSHP